MLWFSIYRGYFRLAERGGGKAIAYTLTVTALMVALPSFGKLLHATGEAFRMPLLFLVGVLCYSNRKQIRISWWPVATALGLTIAFKNTPLQPLCFNIFVLSAILAVGASKLLLSLKPKGDYSYGIYIYGFVVQQTLGHYFPNITSIPSLFISVPVSVALGIISWKYVESPSLTYARKLALRYEQYRFSPRSAA